MNGFVALLFCSILQIGKAIAFSPQTVISFEKRQMYGDDRWPDQNKKRHETRTASDIHDLALWIQDLYRHMHAAIYVSASDALVTHKVNELAGFPNSEIHCFPNDGYGLVTKLRERLKLFSDLEFCHLSQSTHSWQSARESSGHERLQEWYL